MNNLKFRRAELGDIKSITEIDTVAPHDAVRIEYIKRVVTARETWIAVLDSNIVGYAVLNRSFFVRQTIDMLMIAPDHRQSGIGAKLMKYLEQICDDSELWTSTNLSNTPMQRLLTRLEYKLTGFVDNLDPGDPELIFFKKLHE